MVEISHQGRHSWTFPYDADLRTSYWGLSRPQLCLSSP